MSVPNHGPYFETRETGSKKFLPPVAVVFISIALGFAFVLLYSFLAILSRLHLRKRDLKYKMETDLELSEQAGLLANERKSKDDSEDEEEIEQEDGLDTQNSSGGDGSAGNSSTATSLPTSDQDPSVEVSDGKDMQRHGSKGKKPVRNDSIQDGAAGPELSGPLDDLKDEIDRQLAEMKKT